MDMGLAGKVAIVTGGAQGVGEAIARGLAAEGAHVAIVDVQLDKALAVAADLEAASTKAIAIGTDVSDEAQVQAMMDKVIDEFGRIDILVSNAGIVGPQGPWHELTAEGFDHVVGINFKGVFLCTKAVTPHMIAQKSGKIINMSSCAGKTGEQYNGLYSATKAAVWNLTQSMSAELGQYNINVNAVCPAAMNTGLMEKVYRERSAYFGYDPEELRQSIKDSFLLPGELTVEDTANVVVFLASDKTNMMTGQGVNITGGIERH